MNSIVSSTEIQKNWVKFVNEAVSPNVINIE